MIHQNKGPTPRHCMETELHDPTDSPIPTLSKICSYLWFLYSFFSACQRSKRLYHYFDISWRLHDNFRRCQPIAPKFSIHDQEPTGTNPIVFGTCITMTTLNSLPNFFKMNSDNFNDVFFEFFVKNYA